MRILGILLHLHALYKHAHVVTLYSSIPSTALLFWPEIQNISASNTAFMAIFRGRQKCDNQLCCHLQQQEEGGGGEEEQNEEEEAEEEEEEQQQQQQ